MNGFIVALIIIIILDIYFLPTIKAYKKGRKDRFLVFLINLVIGWTFLGWLGCIVWVNQNDE